MSQRTERVDELLREEIGALLTRDVHDPHIGFATVTDVQTTPDLRHAKVWVSVIGAAAERKETIVALDRAMGFIRHELGTRLRIRRIPMLHVFLDDSMERGTRVLRILEEIEEGDVAAGEAIVDSPRGESLPTPIPRLPREGDAPGVEGAEPPAGAARKQAPRRGRGGEGGRGGDSRRSGRDGRPASAGGRPPTRRHGPGGRGA